MGGKSPAGEAKAPQQQQQQPQQQPPQSKKPDAAPSGKKAPAQMPGGCLSWGCKTEATRFGFCGEHYDHFKFGLIKKTGEPVPDYEKKIEHYMAFRDRAKKVA